MIEPMARVRIKPERGGHIAEWGTVIAVRSQPIPFSDQLDTQYLVRFTWLEERTDPMTGNSGTVNQVDERWFAADWIEPTSDQNATRISD